MGMMIRVTERDGISYYINSAYIISFYPLSGGAGINTRMYVRGIVGSIDLEETCATILDKLGEKGEEG